MDWFININKVVKRRNGFLCAVDEAGENILSLRKEEKKQGKFVQMEMSIFTAAHPLLHIRQAPIVLWFWKVERATGNVGIPGHSMCANFFAKCFPHTRQFFNHHDSPHKKSSIIIPIVEGLDWSLVSKLIKATQSDRGSISIRIQADQFQSSSSAWRWAERVYGASDWQPVRQATS